MNCKQIPKFILVCSIYLSSTVGASMAQPLRATSAQQREAALVWNPVREQSREPEANQLGTVEKQKASCDEIRELEKRIKGIITVIERERAHMEEMGFGVWDEISSAWIYEDFLLFVPAQYYPMECEELRRSAEAARRREEEGREVFIRNCSVDSDQQPRADLCAHLQTTLESLVEDTNRHVAAMQSCEDSCEDSWGSCVFHQHEYNRIVGEFIDGFSSILSARRAQLFQACQVVPWCCNPGYQSPLA